jgi:hypothetical protein
MSCCGGKRAQFYGGRQLNAMSAGVQTTPAQRRPSAPLPVIFEYLGVTGIIAMGPVTRKLYRFDGRGAKSAVDARDAPAIARLTSLRRVR